MSRDRDMETEHADLRDAIMTSDADRAVAILAAHLTKTRDEMLPHLAPKANVKESDQARFADAA